MYYFYRTVPKPCHGLSKILSMRRVLQTCLQFSDSILFRMDVEIARDRLFSICFIYTWKIAWTAGSFYFGLYLLN